MFGKIKPRKTKQKLAVCSCLSGEVKASKLSNIVKYSVLIVKVSFTAHKIAVVS